MNQWVWSIDGWIVLIGVLSACSCALLGNYLVLRRMSLMGDAISHAVLPGIAVAYLISQSRSSWPMFVGAAIVGVVTVLLTEAIRKYGKVEHGAAMGVVFSILFAAGLILLRRAADDVDLDPGCVLYGNIVLTFLDTVKWGATEWPRALLIVAGAFLANLLFVSLFYKELKITSFDPDLATSLGINAGVMHYVLMIMVALTIVANFESVGSILVIAMLIVPPAAGQLLTDRLGVMIVLSQVFAIASAALGHLLALKGPGWVGLGNEVTLNTASMMAVVAGAIFAVALIAGPEYGLATRLLRRLSLMLQIVREDILGLLYRWEEMRPPDAGPIHRTDVLEAVGQSFTTRLALYRLVRKGDVVEPGEAGLQLSPTGRNQASRLVRSHRLWESYLAKHFNLPLDHLHMPAERMEHFITPELGDELSDALTDARTDPHGRKIPKSED